MHGWNTDSSKSLSSEIVLTSVLNSGFNIVNAFDGIVKKSVCVINDVTVIHGVADITKIPKKTREEEPELPRRDSNRDQSYNKWNQSYVSDLTK